MGRGGDCVEVMLWFVVVVVAVALSSPAVVFRSDCQTFMQMAAKVWLDTPYLDDHVPVAHNDAAKSAKMDAYVESCCSPESGQARRVREKL
jgi:hypothetical protein